MSAPDPGASSHFAGLADELDSIRRMIERTLHPSKLPGACGRLEAVADLLREEAKAPPAPLVALDGPRTVAEARAEGWTDDQVDGGPWGHVRFAAGDAQLVFMPSGRVLYQGRQIGSDPELWRAVSTVFRAMSRAVAGLPAQAPRPWCRECGEDSPADVPPERCACGALAWTTSARPGASGGL